MTPFANIFTISAGPQVVKIVFKEQDGQADPVAICAVAMTVGDAIQLSELIARLVAQAATQSKEDTK